MHHYNDFDFQGIIFFERAGNNINLSVTCKSNKISMKIVKVISFQNSWDNLIQNHPQELNDIVETIPDFVNEYINRDRLKFMSSRGIWEQKLSLLGWQAPDGPFYSEHGQRIYFGNLGPIKNKVSAYITFAHVDFLNRWLFQQTVLAAKYQVSEIPILIVPTDEFAKRFEDRPMTRMTIETCFRQIQPLTPFSHSYPFLILGYTDQEALFEPEIIEIESDNLNEHVVVDRSIEFPSEYYQAGLSILNYFGTYLKEQYPEENAKVKIEQDGYRVRLIVETDNGEKEIIEKALEEYQLIVSGNKHPAEITTNQKLIVELNSELRIAKYRIETQQDIIQIQRGQIDNLFAMVATGLANKSAINVQVNPIITLNQSNINHNISDALSSLNELKELLSNTSSEYIEIQDLESSLIEIEKEQNPDAVKKSTAMEKFKKMFEAFEKGQSGLSKVVKSMEGGVDLVMKLAGKYNKIAEWCGLPQVPSIFTK
jgi:hypothetical protein